MTTRTAYLALGSNMGEKAANLRKAVRLLEESGSCRVVARSSIYRTRPVGVEDQPDFLNAVIELRTSLSPPELLRLCLAVEERVGRERTIRWGPRVIDIDILLYEGVSLKGPDLVIPHPRMLERAFVLVPLAQIAPDIELDRGLTAREAAERIASDGVERLEAESWTE